MKYAPHSSLRRASKQSRMQSPLAWALHLLRLGSAHYHFSFDPRELPVALRRRVAFFKFPHNTRAARPRLDSPVLQVAVMSLQLCLLRSTLASFMRLKERELEPRAEIT